MEGLGLHSQLACVPVPHGDFLQIFLLCGASGQVCPTGVVCGHCEDLGFANLQSGMEGRQPVFRGAVEEQEGRWLLRQEEGKRNESAQSHVRVQQGHLLFPSLFHPVLCPSSWQVWPLTTSPLLSPQEGLTTQPSAASATLPRQSHVTGSQIIMRPAASAPSLELSSSPKRAIPYVPTPGTTGSRTTSRTWRRNE